MKKLNFSLLICLLLLFSYNIYSQDHNVRFAFLGNSITIGASLANPAEECYPSQVGKMLGEIYGDTCIVENFAVSGRTMLKKGDFSLWNEPAFQNGLNYAPDIVFIMLGTNDTKPYNWDDYGDEFIADYQSMIDTFKVRNPRCRFMICYPPPAFAVNFDIRDSVILNGILPAVDSILKYNEAEFIDFYYPLLDSGYLFPDAIHPNAAGAKVIARMVFNKIVESDLVHRVEPGFTFVTGISTSKRLIAQNNEAVISWTTRNAETVTLDGVPVDLNGSMEVTPSETTTYTIRAVGNKSTDEMKFTQEVYAPVLTEMKVNPRTSVIGVGDSVVVTVTFIDQQGKEMNQNFTVNWEIYEGDGQLVNPTSNSVTFVSTVLGTSRIRGTVGDIKVEARFVVENKTGLGSNISGPKITIYPNPVHNKLYLGGIENQKVEFQLINLCGQRVLKGDTQNGEIDLQQVDAGIYMLKLKTDAGWNYQKLMVK